MLSIKDEIRRATVILLIRHGYQGLRFRDIAEMLDTTRANIHHHYGNKLNLCEEVIVEYVEKTLENWSENWKGDRTLTQKIDGMMESNRQRYLTYNPNGDTAHPWSLIGRMRLERDLIGPRARQSLIDFGTTLERLVKDGIGKAMAAGELSQSTPRDDLALQLVAIANSAGPITQDGGNFSRLEQLYRSFNRIVHHAYGQDRR